MGATKQQQKLQAITNREGKQLKRALLLILPSVSILSFLISYYSSSSITSLLHSLHQFISRRAMFLFCNAILLFLARDSGLLSSSASLDNLSDEFIVRRSGHLRAAPQPDAIEVISTAGHAEEEKAVVEGVGTLELVLVGVEEGEGMGVDELGLVGVEELEVLGVDEFNKRCEEFIERVKRERRPEGLQLVMV